MLRSDNKRSGAPASAPKAGYSKRRHCLLPVTQINGKATAKHLQQPYLSRLQ